MRFWIRMTSGLWQTIQEDLARPHSFAYERVGFLTCGVARLPTESMLLLPEAWHAVDDIDYVANPAVGAQIGARAFRKVLEVAYNHPCAVLHLHRHEHRGLPAFSRTDIRSTQEFVPGFFNACPNRPHGALVLSLDAGAGLVWPSRAAGAVEIQRFNIVGIPLTSWRAA